MPMIAAPVFSKWLRVPLITMIRGNDFDTGIFSVKRSDILREALANSTAICAVSKDKVEKISALFPETKVVWTPNGIELSDWEFSPEDKVFAGKWKGENVDKGKKVLGLFGQLKRKKGGLFFLENLRRSGFADKFHLLFVGDIEPEMLAWLNENQAATSFTNLDFLDRFELLPFFAACDFVVIPSFYDGMPNVLLESAALGIPSIASKTGGMLDVLEDGKHSIMFEPGDDFECRKAIEHAAIVGKTDYEILSSNCSELAKKYDSASETKKYLEIFDKTSNKRSFYAET
jgi:glycosyltransferase involved in cell wall biosynthesis